MPKLFDCFGYIIFFWSNENNEPIHVHVCKGNPNANTTKIWITKNGDCILANNNSKIPDKDLRRICKSIQYNFFYIIQKWKERFGDDSLKFYC